MTDYRAQMRKDMGAGVRAAFAFLKDATPSDVHVPAALGSEKRRARTFGEIMSGKAKIVTAKSFADFISPGVKTAKQAPPRALKPIDAETSHSPFPHDAAALGNMRPDQVPRFFGALTDASGLETKTVRLNGMTALQNRVDHGKVESMRGGAAANKPATVVRMAGRNYIADGHHRLAAAYLDGMATADVRFLDLTPASNAVKRDSVLDWSIPFAVAKAEPDKQHIFGWASVIEKDGNLVVDKQGDVILSEDLEKAAYDFVLTARDHGDMHNVIGTGRCIESMVFTVEKQAALGIDLKKIGWWVGFHVTAPQVWAAHKRGERPEFSIGGSGVREEIR